MNSTPNFMNSPHNFENINKILDYDLELLNQSSEKAKRKLAKKSLFGKKVWREKHIPQWALHFLDHFKLFEKHVNFFQMQGAEIPQNIIETLKENQHILNKLSKRLPISELLISRTVNNRSIDPFNLLSNDPSHVYCEEHQKNPLSNEGLSREEEIRAVLRTMEITDTQNAWHLNLGLLMNIYRRTTDQALKKQLGFFALNYLAKAAPIWIYSKTEKLIKMDYPDLHFQLNPLIFSYHRTDRSFDSYFSPTVRSAFAFNSLIDENFKNFQSDFFLTDTIDLNKLFPIYFQVVDETFLNPTESNAKIQENQNGILTISNAIYHHLSNLAKNSSPLWIKPHLLFDLTSILGPHIITNHNLEKEAQFDQLKATIKINLETALDQMLAELSKTHPEIPDFSYPKKIKAYIKYNLTFICRVRVNEIGALKLINLFTPEDFLLSQDDSFINIQGQEGALMLYNAMLKANFEVINNFINLSGLGLGAISARQHIFDIMNIEQFILSQSNNNLLKVGTQIVDYNVPGNPFVIYFKTPQEVLNTAIFKRFFEKMHLNENEKEMPHVIILGRSVSRLLEGLFKYEISEVSWKKQHENPDLSQLIQTTLFKIVQHLATAEHQMTNFLKFSQEIELIHYEIAVLLTLFTPFHQNEFSEIYKAQLSIIPNELAPFLKTGLTKSAMNTFAGINAAIFLMHSDREVVRAYHADAYYEAVQLIGKNNNIESIIKNESIHMVDLYVGSFNYNIDILPGKHHYEPGTVREDIEAILKSKPATQFLTIALDCTIDYVNSKKVNQLLEHFAELIKIGKLNFIFFRSGQKFDMLGMDNYFGSPFYIINNGAEQWEQFNSIFNDSAFKTDILSVQWFCLSNKYAYNLLDTYRHLLFENTRDILNGIDKKLFFDETSTQQFYISTMAPGVDPAFIDIKLTSKENAIKSARKIRKAFYLMMAASGAIVQTRDSFGFYHPNIEIIEGVQLSKTRSIRINPGLNPSDNKIIIDFLNSLPSILA